MIEKHGAAITYHQLGRIAQERWDFASAEAWYQKSLAIKEKQGDEHGAAITYHQLGVIAQERRDHASAEAWCQKSLAIFEQQGDEHGAAGTYHNLGSIAQERRDLASAEPICRPLGWEHVNLTGDYVWAEANEMTEYRDGYRPLRTAPDPDLLAA